MRMKQNITQLKKRVAHFWNDVPCGTKEFVDISSEGSKEFFDSIEKKRYTFACLQTWGAYIRHGVPQTFVGSISSISAIWASTWKAISCN